LSIDLWGAAWSAQSQPVELQDALDVSEQQQRTESIRDAGPASAAFGNRETISLS
jgi:hypothetical protein